MFDGEEIKFKDAFEEEIAIREDDNKNFGLPDDPSNDMTAETRRVLTARASQVFFIQAKHCQRFWREALKSAVKKLRHLQTLRPVSYWKYTRAEDFKVCVVVFVVV